MRRILIFLILSYNIFSVSLISANGQSSLLVNKEKFIIKDISFDPKNIDIDYLELGFYIKDKLYELKNYEVKLSYIPNSNIIYVETEVENYIYKSEIYASMLNKEMIFIKNTLERNDGLPIENARFFAYIKPMNSYERIASYNKYYSYGKFYFKSKIHKLKLFLTNDRSLKTMKLYSFVNGEKKSDEFALFFLTDEISFIKKIEETFIIGNQNTNLVLDLISYEDELKYWDDYLQNVKNQDIRNELVLIKSYQRRDGSIYNFYNKNKIVKVDDLIYATKVFLKYSFMDDARRTMRYLINSHRGIYNKTNKYLISNYAYDLNRKEVFYEDNYGYMLNLISPSMFIVLLRDYYFYTGDKEFIESSWDLIREYLGEYLLAFVNENGVAKNSGYYRIGIEGKEQFIESQYWVYKALEAYMHLLNIFNLDINPVLIAMNNIKNYVINYIEDGRILDYPNSKGKNEKNIYYLHRDFVESQEKYEDLIIDNLFDMDRYRDRDRLEQIAYIEALYNFDFVEEADNLFLSMLNRTRRADINASYELQKSIELTSRYLMLLGKGQ